MLGNVDTPPDFLALQEPRWPNENPPRGASLGLGYTLLPNRCSQGPCLAGGLLLHHQAGNRVGWTRVVDPNSPTGCSNGFCTLYGAPLGGGSSTSSMSMGRVATTRGVTNCWGPAWKSRKVRGGAPAFILGDFNTDLATSAWESALEWGHWQDITAGLPGTCLTAQGNLTHIDHILANRAAFGMVESVHSHWDVGIVTHAYLSVSLTDGPALMGHILRIPPSWESDPGVLPPCAAGHEHWYGDRLHQELGPRAGGWACLNEAASWWSRARAGEACGPPKGHQVVKWGPETPLATLPDGVATNNTTAKLVKLRRRLQ